MIRTRLVVGTVLTLIAAGVLLGDDYLAPWFPVLFFSLQGLGLLAGRELIRLFPVEVRPSSVLTLTGILCCLAVNWIPTVRERLGYPSGSSWPLLVFVTSCVLIAGMVIEMRRYTGVPGRALPRITATTFTLLYLGVLPCFFVQLRFLPAHAALSLALTIFVPKGNDIAAFFTGTLLGRHRMTPALSPKKTWEGFAGGMIGGTLVAVAGSYLAPVFRGGQAEAAAFGLVVGLAGVLGDLAESLIKRECQTKDASQTIPGFGGLLDVVDSVLFAAPVAYLWFTLTG
jgi:phosphatidate cytidylyltransferase